jgi:serine O-acetyltransferase
VPTTWWIASARAKLAAGYRGLFIDDVNMAQRVSDGDGVYTMPLDLRTGERMDETAWQSYMADLRRQLAAADYIELERGFNDASIVGGAGKFGWQTLAAFIDRRHADGRAVILDGYAGSAAGRLYGLAAYFLLNGGGDANRERRGDPARRLGGASRWTWARRSGRATGPAARWGSSSSAGAPAAGQRCDEAGGGGPPRRVRARGRAVDARALPRARDVPRRAVRVPGLPHPPVGSPPMWATLKADLRANAGGRFDKRAVARNVPTVRFMAVALLRLAQAAAERVPLAGSLIKQANHVLTGADLAYQAEIGPGLVLYHPTGVVIGPGCRVGARATIMQGATLGSDAVTGGDGASPVVGDDVFIGPGAAVFGGVSLGDRVRVGANSVVTDSFADDVVIAGAPARVVGHR